MTRPLEEFEDGARVLKPNAIPFDFAFGRVGTVIRENVDGRRCLGVLFDGAWGVFEYSGDTLVERAATPPESDVNREGLGK